MYAGLVLLVTQALPVSLSTRWRWRVPRWWWPQWFSPLRRWVQRIADRRFNRARYDADRTISAFAAPLKDAVDLVSVRDDLAGVALYALEPIHVSVWLSEPG